jgi:hypothetical protein
MLIGVAVISVVSVAALVTALITHSGVIAWVCVGFCVIGLILLIIDGQRERRRVGMGSSAMGQTEHHHTADDELFGEHDVARDLVREENVIDPDMFRSDIPFEEAMENLW